MGLQDDTESSSLDFAATSVRVSGDHGGAGGWEESAARGAAPLSPALHGRSLNSGSVSASACLGSRALESSRQGARAPPAAPVWKWSSSSKQLLKNMVGRFQQVA